MKILYIDDLIYGLPCYLLTHFHLNPYMEYWNEVWIILFWPGTILFTFLRLRSTIALPQPPEIMLSNYRNFHLGEVAI